MKLKHRSDCSRTRILVQALALAGLVGLPGLAAAQAAPVELEGPISNIVANADGSATLTVFGQPFRVPPTASIRTPTSTLTVEQLTDPTSLPGRSQPGFIGGTAIMVGSVDGAGAAPQIDDVFVEPAENVALGVVTKNDGTGMSALGIPLVAIDDARIPNEGFHNEHGFEVRKETVPVGAGVAIEGYYANDALHYFLVETTGGELVNDVPQTSIVRARCSAGGTLEVQGSSYQPAQAAIQIKGGNGFVYGTIDTTVDPLDPQFGTYRFRTDVNNGEVNEPGACPSEVVALNLTHSPQTEATAGVDGVVAPPPAPAVNLAPTATDDLENSFVDLSTILELIDNDTDPNGTATLDPTSLQLTVDPLLPISVVNNNDGTVNFTASATGIYSFSYSVADSGGLRSNEANVTVTVDQVLVDNVSVDRANYRTSQSRWNLRGSSNQPGVTVTLSLVRNSVALGDIGTVTADATGAWTLDARNSPLVAIHGDVVRATSTGGGQDEAPIAVSR